MLNNPCYVCGQRERADLRYLCSACIDRAERNKAEAAAELAALREKRSLARKSK